MNDLAGHRVGIIRSGPANSRLLETALTQYDIRLDAVQIEPLQPGDVADAIRAKRVDAVMAVDVVSTPLMHDMVKGVATAARGPPAVIPLAGTETRALLAPASTPPQSARDPRAGSHEFAQDCPGRCLGASPRRDARNGADGADRFGARLPAERGRRATCDSARNLRRERRRGTAARVQSRARPAQGCHQGP